MGKLFLVRHGESMGNVHFSIYKNDLVNFLSLKGIKQAEIAGIDMSRYVQENGISVNHIVVSNMTRALQTATIIAQVMDDWKRDYIIDDRFNEWVQPQNTYDQFDPSKARLVTKEEFNHLVQMAYRETIEPLLENGNVVLVSHFFTMRAIFDLIQPDFQPNHINNAAIFVKDNDAELVPLQLIKNHK